MTIPEDKPKINSKERRWARRFSLQAIYQWQIANQSLENIEQQFLLDKNLGRVDLAYFREILYGVPKYQTEIDSYLKRYVARPITDIDPVESSILRIATYELLKRLDVPYRVILNEALELGKLFGATDGYKFVNGILDKIAREVRRAEVIAKKPSTDE